MSRTHEDEPFVKQLHPDPVFPDPVSTDPVSTVSSQLHPDPVSPSIFAQRLVVDGKLLASHPLDLIEQIKAVIGCRREFVYLSLQNPEIDAAMEVTSIDEDKFVINGVEDSTQRGSFCFVSLNDSNDNSLVDKVEGFRAYSIIENRDALLKILLLYAKEGRLDEASTWHVSRVGTGQAKEEIPWYEIFGNSGWHKGSFNDFLKMNHSL